MLYLLFFYFLCVIVAMKWQHYSYVNCVIRIWITHRHRRRQELSCGCRVAHRAEEQSRNRGKNACRIHVRHVFTSLPICCNHYCHAFSTCIFAQPTRPVPYRQSHRPKAFNFYYIFCIFDAGSAWRTCCRIKCCTKCVSLTGESPIRQSHDATRRMGVLRG